jgi:hypothetical protein
VCPLYGHVPGEMLGLVYQAVLGPKSGGTPPHRLLMALGVLVLAFAADGVNYTCIFFPMPHHFTN